MTEYNRHQKPQEEDAERLLPRIAASSAVAIVTTAKSPCFFKAITTYSSDTSNLIPLL
jgi:hypothetical protein